MQKLFFAVPAFILFAGTIFSETTFSPSLDFRSGILMYEADRSSFFHTSRFDADFDSEENAYSLGARYLYGKFPHSVFCGNVHAGSVDFSFTRDFYSLRAGGGAFSFPDEVRILNGKPHFILSGLSGFGVTLGGTVDFFILKKKFKLDAAFFGENQTSIAATCTIFTGNRRMRFSGEEKRCFRFLMTLSFFSLAEVSQWIWTLLKIYRLENLERLFVLCLSQENLNFRVLTHFP